MKWVGRSVTVGRLDLAGLAHFSPLGFLACTWILPVPFPFPRLLQTSTSNALLQFLFQPSPSSIAGSISKRLSFLCFALSLSLSLSLSLVFDHSLPSTPSPSFIKKSICKPFNPTQHTKRSPKSPPNNTTRPFASLYAIAVSLNNQ